MDVLESRKQHTTFAAFPWRQTDDPIKEAINILKTEKLIIRWNGAGEEPVKVAEPRYFLLLFLIILPHFGLYAVVSLHMCVLPYKYRTLLEMLPKLMKFCDIMGSRLLDHAA